MFQGFHEAVEREATVNVHAVSIKHQESLLLMKHNEQFEKRKRALIYVGKRLKETQNEKNMNLKTEKVSTQALMASSIDENWSTLIYRNPPRLKREVLKGRNRFGEDSARKTLKTHKNLQDVRNMQRHHDAEYMSIQRRLLAVVSSGAENEHGKTAVGTPRPTKGDNSVNMSVDNSTVSNSKILSRRRWQNRRK